MRSICSKYMNSVFYLQKTPQKHISVVALIGRQLYDLDRLNWMNFLMLKSRSISNTYQAELTAPQTA